MDKKIISRVIRARESPKESFLFVHLFSTIFYFLIIFFQGLNLSPRRMLASDRLNANRIIYSLWTMFKWIFLVPEIWSLVISSLIWKGCLRYILYHYIQSTSCSSLQVLSGFVYLCFEHYILTSKDRPHLILKCF